MIPCSPIVALITDTNPMYTGGMIITQTIHAAVHACPAELALTTVVWRTLAIPVDTLVVASETINENKLDIAKIRRYIHKKKKKRFDSG
jgi:hypothetical protein